MKNNNNKRNIIIASVVGVIILLIAIAGVVHSTSKEKVETANVESSQEVNLDSAISEVTEASIGQSFAEEKTEKSTEATSEASVEVSVEASTEASTEETVASSESSSEVIDLTTAQAEETEVVDTTTIKTEGTPTGKTGANGWPVISGYKGDGNGPGLAWRSDINYLEKFPDMMGTYDDIEAYTASNGVTIKVIIFYQGNNKLYSPIIDGEGKDLESSSPFMTAVNEAAYGANGIFTDTDLSANVNATLPNTSYKRTSIDPNDSQVAAYKQAYDYKRSTCDGGTYYPRPAGTINDSIFFFTDGVGEYDKKGVALWEFRNTGSYWSLTIYQNPAEYQWSGIKEVLEYLSPDGAALYASIYDDFYVASWDNPIEDIGSWWPCGGSQIMRPDTQNLGYSLYYFK